MNEERTYTHNVNNVNNVDNMHDTDVNDNVVDKMINEDKMQEQRSEDNYHDENKHEGYHGYSDHSDTMKNSTYSQHQEQEPVSHVYESADPEKIQEKPEKKRKSFTSKRSLFFIGIVIILVGGWLFYNHQLAIPGISSPSSQLTGDVVNSVGSQDMVAQVNGHSISTADFDKEVSMALFIQGAPASYKSMIPQDQLLDSVIKKELLYQEAQKQGYTSTQEDVENLLMQDPSFNKTAFVQSLSSYGVTYDELVAYLQQQLVIQNFLKDTMADSVQVSDQEVRDYYDQNPDQFNVGEQISASHILVNTSEAAQQIINKLNAGGDFATLAKENSIGPSAPNGGDLGYFGKGQMVPEFEQAAFALQNIGDYTKTPVKTQFGYHVIELTGRKEARQLSFDEAKDQIEQNLLGQKQSDAVDSYLTDLRSNADVKVYLQTANATA